MDAGTDSTGRLIAICGIDGSGKATQTDLLARKAEAEGHRVARVSFPRYGEGFFADLIERYLRGEFARRAADVSPYLAALPYALDRWQAAPEIHQWLQDGRLVLCNRYVPANMAHQGSKLGSEADRRAFVNWVAEFEYGILGLPVPDLCILLDVPPALAVELMTGRNARGGAAEADDIHESDLEHLKATAQVYRQIATEAADPSMAASRGPWAVIECAPAGAVLPPEQIAERVWAEVRKVV